MRLLGAGACIKDAGLRVFVCCGLETVLKSPQQTEALYFGDVVVAEAAEGAVQIETGQCLLITEP